jgi:HEAT repeat protein
MSHITQLVEMFTDPQTRSSAAFRLGQLVGQLVSEAKESVPNLAALLEDKDFTVARTAAIALGAFGPLAKEAVPNLVAALNNGWVTVREEVATTLGKIGPDAKEAVPALQRIVDTCTSVADYEFREHARWALVQIQSRSN